ncbi:1,2-phenylacetyl-CoA epoxidase subunit PaaC [Novosphingobium pentaromativorans]|nr:1,2-phenylacetyl-CoA epoxidase subunit PaaC [Novosphingobium pentaromativorans]AIT81869.1 phenylacetic acid degradation protein [Novosphingobium pentaromativorans US6-1]
MSKTLFNYLQALGDDSLILAQRLCEWSGKAPTIEVDLTLSNIALDLIGQVQLFLGYAGEVEGEGRDADRLAYHRAAEAFRNCLLVEQPNGDFAQTMARQLLFSTYCELLFDALCASSDQRIAEIAAKAVKEVRYHAEVAADWTLRLGDGTEESHTRMQDGLDWFWRFEDELFAVGEGESGLVAQGIAADKTGLRAEYDHRIDAVLAPAGLERGETSWPLGGGRDGKHSEHLSPLLAEMQVLPRAHPDARW